MTLQIDLTGTKLIKFLKKTIKGVLSDKGINPSTYRGNKELDILVKRLAKESFTSITEAKIMAEKVGENIVELSQQKGKTYLDKGIIQQLSLQKQLFLLPSVSSIAFSVQPQTKIETVKPIVETSDIGETPEVQEVEPQKIIAETSDIEETPEIEEVELEEIVKNPEEMRLKERLTEDIKLAMKAKDKIRLETVRSIKKFVLEKEVDVRPSGQEILTPEQELEILTQQAKQRRESIEQFRKGGRDDLADKEAQELAIIETYLPPQLSDDEISQIIDEIIASVGATSPKDMGKVMGSAMQQLKGKADGKKVQELVKLKLT
ncbi:GatB/YqeY domain-containing protein [Aphanothece sacrum]|uniref:Uncharacterized protein n=1 Tax=Aphanothece sacrum FPU1 TaxID=1920663 RepID=A0A401IBT9_APHSA|nr:GatB/YqeY domain-containing protein [Aphanothece sacrum]GBF78691.1 hypothetical protein AsFPU1_0080 [Aphanothece sacrum FPU1]GBF84980.1 hypothetical protein AsFPU3_2035 [Aphanothece sacrum FPU3]